MKNDTKNKDAISKFRDLNLDPALIDSRGFNFFKTNATSITSLSNLNTNIAGYFPTSVNSNSFIVKNNTSDVLIALTAAGDKNENFSNNIFSSTTLDAGNKIAGDYLFICPLYNPYLS